MRVVNNSRLFKRVFVCACAWLVTAHFMITAVAAQQAPALSVDIDSALGTHQVESSFADSQRVLVKKLKLIAPQAAYYWVDIGATIAAQAAGWSARNKVIYDQAPELGYGVISRYKAIFGSDADPLNIQAGRNFPDCPDERGYGSPGNVHGAYPELATAILEKLAQPAGQTVNCKL